MSEPRVPDHYSAHYEKFAADVHTRVRRDAFGEDVGQNSWLTADELDRFAAWLQLDGSRHLLDVACGSGGPTLYLARTTGCEVTGVELYVEAVETANRGAAEAGLASRARFFQADATRPLPLGSGSFQAILCIDAVNHLSDRRAVLVDWARLLAVGGRVGFTDPLVVTGTLGSDEMAVRTSVGFGLFVPPGENERLLAQAGLTVLAVDDTTDSAARIAQRRYDARARHAPALRESEGTEAFEGRQRFFEMVARLNRERRLSRFAFLAERPIRPA